MKHHVSGHCTGTQILAFLSGPPNYGRGATSSSSRTRQDSRPQKQQALHSDLEAGDMFEDIALLQNHTDRESQHPAPPPENGTEQVHSPQFPSTRHKLSEQSKGSKCGALPRCSPRQKGARGHSTKMQQSQLPLSGCQSKCLHCRRALAGSSTLSRWRAAAGAAFTCTLR